MLLSEMKTALQRYGFDTTDPLTTWLNWGMKEVQKYHNWKNLELIIPVSVGAGQPTFTITSVNAKKVITAKVRGQGDPMTEITMQAFQRSVPDSSSPPSGVPAEYFVWNSDPVTLEFWLTATPIANTTIELMVLLKEPDLVDSNPNDTTNYLSDDFHPAIVLRAAVFGLQAENEEDRANALFSTWTDMMDKQVGDDDKTIGPLYVEDVMEYGA